VHNCQDEPPISPIISS